MLSQHLQLIELISSATALSSLVCIDADFSQLASAFYSFKKSTVDEYLQGLVVWVSSTWIHRPCRPLGPAPSLYSEAQEWKDFCQATHGLVELEPKCPDP